MAGATTAAVDCIREALVEPSLALPFLEPYLPYYDSIRDQPEFIALLSELDGVASRQQGLPPIYALSDTRKTSR